MPLRILLLICLLSFSFAPRSASASVCFQYVYLNHELGCGKDNYLRQFGYRFCLGFEQMREAFSPDGRSFLDQVKLCLLGELQRAKRKLSCGNVREFAIRTHESCYLNLGFCQLPGSDRFRIFRKIWSQLAYPDVLGTALAINAACNEAAKAEEDWTRDLYDNP